METANTQLREGNESQAETRILQSRQHLLLGQSFFLELRNESLGKSGDLLYHEKNMDTTFVGLLCHEVLGSRLSHWLLNGGP